MMFPGGADSAEIQKAAADKVKNDIGTFVIFGVLLELVARGSQYFGIDGLLV
uniref:DoxX family protein n=1 Tax=Heterorhabditis bacteriophora TaxID=37862 RepID=A0A1I7XTA4_HETBA